MTSRIIGRFTIYLLSVTELPDYRVFLIEYFFHITKIKV